MILSLDPGRKKCGAAVLTQQGAVKYKQVLLVEEVKTKLKQLQVEYQLPKLILGDGTNSQAFKQRLASVFEQVIVVDETNSTLEGRSYYWRENPPRGWRKLLPTSLQTPPEPIDDYVAVILGRRYLKNRE